MHAYVVAHKLRFFCSFIFRLFEYLKTQFVLVNLLVRRFDPEGQSFLDAQRVERCTILKISLAQLEEILILLFCSFPMGSHIRM